MSNLNKHRILNNENERPAALTGIYRHTERCRPTERGTEAEREREREREKERKKERTDRQTDRQTGMGTGRERDRILNRRLLVLCYLSLLFNIG